MFRELTLPLGRINGDGGDPPELAPGYYPPGWLNGVFYPYGFFIPLETEWRDWPGAAVSVNVGDTVRITAVVNYMGPAKTFNLYGAIGTGSYNMGTGNDTGPFIEGSPAGTNYFSTTEHLTGWGTFRPTVDVVVPNSCDGFGLSGKLAAVYVKITDGLPVTLGETLSPYYRGALQVATKEGEFTGLAISSIAKV
jgi:hypothetical protein